MANGNNPQARANGKRIDKVPVWRTNQVADDTCDWSGVDPSVLRGAVDAVTKGGGAVMFGLTSDGGAYSVCVLQDDHKMKEYPHGAAACEELLRGIAEYYVETRL